MTLTAGETYPTSLLKFLVGFSRYGRQTVLDVSPNAFIKLGASTFVYEGDEHTDLLFEMAPGNRPFSLSDFRRYFPEPADPLSQLVRIKLEAVAAGSSASRFSSEIRRDHDVMARFPKLLVGLRNWEHGYCDAEQEAKWAKS